MQLAKLFSKTPVTVSTKSEVFLKEEGGGEAETMLAQYFKLLEF